MGFLELRQEPGVRTSPGEDAQRCRRTVGVRPAQPIAGSASPSTFWTFTPPFQLCCLQVSSQVGRMDLCSDDRLSGRRTCPLPFMASSALALLAVLFQIFTFQVSIHLILPSISVSSFPLSFPPPLFHLIVCICAGAPFRVIFLSFRNKIVLPVFHSFTQRPVLVSNSQKTFMLLS